MVERFKHDVEITRNGTFDVDVSRHPENRISIQFGGDLGGGSLQILSVMGGVRSAMPDYGPFNDENDKDQYGLPIRRILIEGRTDIVSVILTDAENPKITMAIR